MKVSPSLAAIVVAGIVAASVVADEPEKIGQVRFAVSCRADVQKPFERAVALLHSFWYLEAAKAFTAVAQADPDCAIAYWGLAMSNWTQIWSPPPPAALKRGWEAVEKAKAASAKTARERDFVAAAEAFFKDADKVDHRTRATCPRTSTCCSACGRRRCRATSRPRRRRRTVETPTTGCTRSTIWYTATCSRPRTRKLGGFSTRRARS